jgi:hypothetical protein
MTRWIVAVDEFTYAGEVRMPGAVFEVSDSDARILLTIGRCKPAAADFVAAKVAEVTDAIDVRPPPRRRYFRRNKISEE